MNKQSSSTVMPPENPELKSSMNKTCAVTRVSAPLFLRLAVVLLTLVSPMMASAATEVTKGKIQKLFDELGLRDGRGKPLRLEGLGLEALREALKADYYRPGIVGTYRFQVSADYELSIFYAGGKVNGKKTGSQTYRNGRWESWSRTPVYQRIPRIDAMIDDCLLPGFYASASGVVPTTFEPFYLLGFRHNLNIEEVIKGYLARHPEESELIASIEEDRKAIALVNQEYKAAKEKLDEITNTIHTISVLNRGDRSELLRLIEKYQPSMDRLDVQLNGLTKQRAELREARERKLKMVKEEPMRQQLRLEERSMVAKEVIAAHFLEEAGKQETAPMKALHMRMEAAKYTPINNARMAIIEETLLAAEKQIGTESSECCHHAALIWKALQFEPRWSDDRAATELRKAIGMALRALAIYKRHQVEATRVGHLHRLLAKLYLKQAESAIGIDRREIYRRNMIKSREHERLSYVSPSPVNR